MNSIQRSRATRKYWKDKTNQLSKLKEIEQKLGIKEPTDWYKFEKKDVSKYGGGGLLLEYNNSAKKMLIELYPNVKWDLTKYVY